jgi:uncharacterized integral membrane protein (TIGR00698 family)
MADIAVHPTHHKISHLLPGLILCLVVSATAYGLQAAESVIFGKVWLEALVLAIVLGAAVRSVWRKPADWRDGIEACAKYPLEIAVMLLGASVSTQMLIDAGPLMLIGIFGVVASAIVISFGIGKALGLPTRMALLVACGNSICGNSAIAAVAPVIGADSDDVAASIAFTAVLGVLVVLGLPVLGLLLGMKPAAFGAFAGLTVYAVPQVIAAAAPMGASAIQMGTLVKLTRVLMLGPVSVVLSLIAPRLTTQTVPDGEFVAGEPVRRRPDLAHLVPWFIVGFIAMLALRALGLIPHQTLGPISDTAGFLTVVSMAALGLGVDVRTVAKAGGRVTLAVVLSLLALGGISLALLKVLGMT